MQVLCTFRVNIFLNLSFKSNYWTSVPDETRNKTVNFNLTKCYNLPWMGEVSYHPKCLPALHDATLDPECAMLADLVQLVSKFFYKVSFMSRKPKNTSIIQNNSCCVEIVSW
jgi:hypothetical protein